ncbi:MmgE/PrpD family protein [Halovenus sp. HT40]|uniref:MmgE/PrpD family protein n=1 Tax=Halovenus sp. HT40 TaxID=3126691 RepID=UPI00300EDB54
MGQQSSQTPETRLATFVAETNYGDIPTEAVRAAECAFVDTVGVTMAGSDGDAGARAMRIAAHEKGETTLLGGANTSSLLAAVFANATAGHALDFDDTALSATDGHPSVPMVAPLLAIGERNAAAGRELLTAYVIGFETQAYLAAPISPEHYERGWHATATIGVFGATAATASLLDLSQSEIRHALNIAASMPAGLKRNFGSMTKPVHAGQAARSGVSSARLAAEGVDADPTAISGERGFFDLYRGQEPPDLTAAHDLGEQWQLLTDGIDVKKYACCYYTHAAIYGAVQLLAEYSIGADDIESIRIEASQGAIDAVEYDDPETPTQAKFSMPYLIAYAVVNGTVDIDAFNQQSISDPEVEEIRKRVSFALDENRPYDDYGASVTVEMTDGSVHERTQEQPPGTADNPLTDAELREKFEMCCQVIRSEDSAETAYRRLDSLRNVEDISTVTGLL